DRLAEGTLRTAAQRRFAVSQFMFVEAVPAAAVEPDACRALSATSSTWLPQEESYDSRRIVI
ncbi:MAG: hypothetical protein WBA53_09765, partial [Burkholderiaceae bacterium]